jgi:hypothetical protein
MDLAPFFTGAPDGECQACAGGEFVAFTPTDEARDQAAVMMPNLLRFAQEHGIELPGTATPA